MLDDYFLNQKKKIAPTKIFMKIKKKKISRNLITI